MATNRNLKVFNKQRLQTSQLAASAPITNPSRSRSQDALNVPKRGVLTKPGRAVPAPVQGFFRNAFNSATNGNSRLGDGYVIQYPVARVVPALRNRLVGGHPVIMKVGNSLQRSK